MSSDPITTAAPSSAALRDIADDIMAMVNSGVGDVEKADRMRRWAISLRNLADGNPPGPAPVPRNLPRFFA